MSKGIREIPRGPVEASSVFMVDEWNCVRSAVRRLFCGVWLLCRPGLSRLVDINPRSDNNHSSGMENTSLLATKSRVSITATDTSAKHDQRSCETCEWMPQGMRRSTVKGQSSSLPARLLRNSTRDSYKTRIGIYWGSFVDNLTVCKKFHQHPRILLHIRQKKPSPFQNRLYLLIPLSA